MHKKNMNMNMVSSGLASGHYVRHNVQRASYFSEKNPDMVMKDPDTKRKGLESPFWRAQNFWLSLKDQLTWCFLMELKATDCRR